MALSISYNQSCLHKCSSQSFTEQSLRNTPQTTFKNATSTSKNPKIPDPSLFKFRTNSIGVQEDSRRLPCVAECAAHLELLHAFQHLRIKVQSSKSLDDVFGVKPEPSTVFRKRTVYHGHSKSWVREPVKLRDDTFEKWREEIWPLYLRLAASRFLSWVTAVEDFSWQNASDGFLHIPPIDILMVWHALLLNPKWFQSFEQRKLKHLSTFSFPWEQIHAAIDSENRNWSFELSKRDCVWFQEKTGLHPDLFGVLTKNPKSLVVSSFLSNYGISRDNGEDCGLRSGDIPGIPASENILDPLELRFLDSCRVAVSKDTTVEDLVNAVKRQSAFVNKMEKQLWIRSPAVEGTLNRAIIRYERFLKLFKSYPQTMLVPTLDVDLIWHTHQCSPNQYALLTAEIAGRFLNHDDKLGTATLEPAFENTKNLYRIRFADEYRICNCWDCEALRSTIAAKDNDIQSDMASVASQVYFKVTYYRAVEIARQRGEKLLPIYNMAEIS